MRGKVVPLTICPKARTAELAGKLRFAPPVFCANVISSVVEKSKTDAKRVFSKVLPELKQPVMLRAKPEASSDQPTVRVREILRLRSAPAQNDML